MDRLGKRLARPEPPSATDLDLLTDILIAYDDVLAEAEQRCSQVTSSFAQHIGVATNLTTRVKTTSTIREKLQRERGMGLKGMQDLAGMRITGNLTRLQQDILASGLVDEFAREPRAPARVDRRVHPSHGYRALHVIAHPRGIPVEIQIRTPGQDAWAQLVEKLGDTWGRGIRYGGPPPDPEHIVFGSITRAQMLSAVMSFGDDLDRVERAEKEDELDEIELEALREDIRSMSEAAAEDIDVADMMGRVETLKDEAAERRSERVRQRVELQELLENLTSAAEDW